MAQPKLELRSPLKDKTLRYPGQSVDDAIRKAGDKFMEDGMVIVWFGGFLFVELIQWLFGVPAKIMALGVAISLAIATASYVPRLVRGRKEIQRLKRARDGERAVAECLDLLREDGHRVFHDIVRTNFNIDHVIIGPKGVFTIETKTLNKRVGQDVPLRFDGKTVYVGDAALPDNPVPQAMAQASWLKRTLADSTGKTFGVKPVVVFPGWFVEPSEREEVWVLEPKALRGFLKNEPVRVKAEDVHLAAHHLKRYIRATNT